MWRVDALISLLPRKEHSRVFPRQLGTLRLEYMQEEDTQIEEEPWEKCISVEWLKSFPIYAKRKAFLDSHFFIRKGCRILEAGSGPAHDSLIFAERGAKVFAVDKSRNALPNAVRIYEEKGFVIEVFLSDIRELPFKDSTFDMTWNAGVLEHFEEEVSCKILGEMMRVTKPGGTILAIVPNRNYLWYQVSLRKSRKRQYAFERSLTIKELKNMFRKNDIKIVGISGNYVHPNPSFLWPNVPLVRRISRLSEIAFSPVEVSSRPSKLKALLSLDICIWGKK